MNRRTFITTSSAAAIGFGASSLVTIRSHGKETVPTSKSHQVFWPDKARLVISISIQFETGAKLDRGAGSPFPPIDPKYLDLPVQKWFEYPQKQTGAVFMRKDEIARWGLSAPNIPHES